MNKKLIAAAVSVAVMAPLAAQAQTEVNVYGRVNNAVVVDGSGKSTTDISGVASRLGVKAKSDLGNGLTASARYEFATTTDKKNMGIGGTRIATVGLSGGFGSVDIGNQWSSFYNTVGTHIDPTYTLGYILYTSAVGGVYRSSNTIKYSNSMGPLSLELDFRLNDSEEGTDVAEEINGNGSGFGLSYAVNDNLTLAAAYDIEDGVGTADDVKRTGVAARMSFGDMWMSLGWHENKEGAVQKDQRQVWTGTSFGNTSAMLGYGKASVANNVDIDNFILGVYHSLGGGLTLYFEGVNGEKMQDDNVVVDAKTSLFGMRYDF